MIHGRHLILRIRYWLFQVILYGPTSYAHLQLIASADDLLLAKLLIRARM